MSPLALAILKGVLSGVLAAAAVDYHAFLNWRSFHEFAEYDWRTAAFRWVQGAIAGAVAGAGLGAMLG